MRFSSLADWLRWQETLHPAGIELRLERVASVWARLFPVPGRAGTPGAFPCPVISVGGTNGKGSCVAYLEAWYQAGGYRTGAYTSPHLLRYNERIRIAGVEIADGDLCAAFARIDAARGETLLTYFEFGTLAALDLFVRAGIEVAILEVGLGGRLDAVNIIDADCALVTMIGRDHTAWLGEAPDQIAFEKAGIFRPGRPAIIGQREPPPRLRARAAEIGATIYQLGQEFDWSAQPAQWTWRGPTGSERAALPPPALRGRIQYDNAAAALCAVHCLQRRLPVPVSALRQGLHRVRLEGRFTVLPGRPTLILDVAHNAQAAAALADNLAAFPCRGRRHALFAPLADKDAVAISAALAPLIQQWHLAPAPGPRGLPGDALEAAVRVAVPAVAPLCYPDLQTGLAGAIAAAAADDLVLVFGSFVTVEAALRWRSD
ncbi:MAG: bifunctional tetrahydrofolate synthase/dihydrofolate synthase [Chromatiaceae bacterium]|nr:MAG: bifunctional tetrahydrofolate synthase/dihydrofolate synthase [Chromatiaceae bacterium]